jgi:hypothetical protein
MVPISQSSLTRYKCRRARCQMSQKVPIVIDACGPSPTIHQYKEVKRPLIEAFPSARPNLGYLGTISFQGPRLAPRPSGLPSRYRTPD